MVRVYTTRAKKSSVFLCFFIKNFSGFSIPRVVNVFIPVFSRVCGIFYENVSHACEIVSAGNFGQKTTIQSDLLDGRRRGFSVFRILPDGARALRSKARRQAARALITNADAPVRLPAHSTSSSFRSARFVFSPARSCAPTRRAFAA